MNRFSEVKRVLTNRQVIQKYLGQPDKHNSTGDWYKSPFRRERTASLCVSDKGIHDFGDSTHYDIISFTQRYFNTTVVQALNILCKDFGIEISNEYETEETLKMLKQKREEEKQIKNKIDMWFNSKFQEICNELDANEKMIKIFQPKFRHDILPILYRENAILNYEFEIFYIANDRIKERLYLLYH